MEGELRGDDLTRLQALVADEQPAETDAHVCVIGAAGARRRPGTASASTRSSAAGADGRSRRRGRGLGRRASGTDDDDLMTRIEETRMSTTITRRDQLDQELTSARRHRCIRRPATATSTASCSTTTT